MGLIKEFRTLAMRRPKHATAQDRIEGPAAEAAPAAPPEDIVLLREIRDLLVKQSAAEGQ